MDGYQEIEILVEDMRIGDIFGAYGRVTHLMRAPNNPPYPGERMLIGNKRYGPGAFGRLVGTTVKVLRKVD